MTKKDKNYHSEIWQSTKLGFLCDISAGGTPSTKVNEYWDGDILWMNSGDLNKRVIYNVDGRITKKGLKSSSAKIVPINSVLIGLAGQGKTRGTVAINKVELATNQSVAFFVPKKIDYNFLFFNLYIRYEELRKISAGDGGRGGLNLRLLKNLKILLPPILEQKRIIAVLEIWDEYLEKLEKKIELKKNIKRGLMRKLLSGEVRLKGFDGEWRIYEMRDMAICLDNKRKPLNSTERMNKKGSIPYCGANGIVDYIDDFIFNEDIILIAEDGGQFDEYELRPIAYRMKEKCWVNNHAHVIKAKNGFSQDLIFYQTVHKNILAYLSGGTRVKLNKSELMKIKYFLPIDLEEQTAIAKILTTADQEIEYLEKKKKIIAEQKKYLLNNLVTGKIRTPENLRIRSVK